MRKHTTRASVQQDYVRLREVSGDMLCLVSATAPTQRIYRAVLEVSAINFTLKSEDEQEAIIAGYRAFLKALTFPLQVLIRSQRLDLRSYMQQIREASSTAAGGTPTWRALAESLVDFITKLASQRTLIERHFYLVIPLAPERAGSRSFFPGHPLRGRTKRRQVSATTGEKAKQELDVRVETVRHQLASIGLHSRRLRGDELAILYHSCLTPERAIRHPLTSAILSGVGRPNRVATGKHGKRGLTASRAAEPAGEYPSLPAHLTERQEDGVPPVPAPDLLHLADLLAPSSVEVSRDALCVEDEYVRGIAITAFPREVSAGGWLAPLLLHDEIADVVLHFHPQDSSAMLRQLKRRRAGYTSTRHFNQRQGRLDDPELDVAQEDVLTLLGQVASGEERLCDLGFYVLVRASDRHALDERTERMMAVLSLLFLDAAAHPTTFEHAQAFRSALPEARDELMRTLTLDTTSLAMAFPFLSNALSMPGGVLVGMTDTGEPVLLNAWDERLENPHAFIGGVTGAGKSYLGKLMIERDLLLHGKPGRHCYVIDPDQEYTHLAQALGGNVVRIAPGSEQHLNPFDLLPAGCDFQAYLREARRGDRLAEKVQDLQALLDIMLADYVPSGSTPLSKREKGLLDRALYETYRKVGITSDPRSHYHQPPLLRDLYEVLTSGVCGADEYDLSSRLYRYVQGSLAGLFAEQTDIDLDTHLLVWDIRDMRVVTMTQNPELFVRDEWGSVVAANAAIKILKMQDRTSVSAVGERFQLTRGEQQRLLTFGKHEALLLAGDKRVIITIQASQQEHELITTDPVELATRYGLEQEHQMHPTSRREQRSSDAVAVTSAGANHATAMHNGRKPTKKEDGHHVPEPSTTSPEL